MNANPSLVSGVHHVSLLVEDLDEALRFYRDLLGLQQIPRPDLGFTGAWLKIGQTEVHLLCAERSAELGTAPTAISPLANHLAFAVDDLEVVVAKVSGAGHQVRGGIAGLRQAFVQDPAGNVVEFSAVANPTASRSDPVALSR